MLAWTMLAAGCGATIVAVNGRPERYYQQKLKLVGQITRLQVAGADVVLEIADEHGHRLIVKAAAPIEPRVGDWVKVTGVLVPEARVNGTPLYDVLSAEEVEGTRAPLLRGLM